MTAQQVTGQQRAPLQALVRLLARANYTHPRFQPVLFKSEVGHPHLQRPEGMTSPETGGRSVPHVLMSAVMLPHADLASSQGGVRDAPAGQLAADLGQSESR